MLGEGTMPAESWGAWFGWGVGLTEELVMFAAAAVNALAYFDIADAAAWAVDDDVATLEVVDS